MLTFKHHSTEHHRWLQQTQKVSKEKLATPSVSIFDTADLPAEVVNDVSAPVTSKSQ